MRSRAVSRSAWWVAGAAIVLGAACLLSLQRSSAPRPLRFGAYTDPQLGFTVSVPPGWTLFRIRRTPHLREFFALPQDVKPEEASTATRARLTIRRSSGPGSIRRIVDEAQSAVERDAEEYQVLQQAEAKIGGKPSYSVTTTSTSALGTRWLRVAAVENRNLAAVWEQQVVPASAARTVRPDMDRMLASFHWK
ncbi:MAG: hypothetical protein ACUVTZ_08260 [Armatimonadota bacterium]